MYPCPHSNQPSVHSFVNIISIGPELSVHKLLKHLDDWITAEPNVLILLIVNLVFPRVIAGYHCYHEEDLFIAKSLSSISFKCLLLVHASWKNVT